MQPPPPTGPADPAAGEPALGLADNDLLSVILPVHNLGPAIADNVREVHRVLRGRIPFEIIAVNDGSADRTAEELRRIEAELSDVKTVHLKDNAGKGNALKRGFEASRGTLVLFLDADLDLPPQQISTFLRILSEQRVDAVIGSKQHPASRLDYPWHRRCMSLSYYWLVKLLLGLPVRDTQTGIKLFRRQALAWAFPRLLVKRFAFDVELLAILHERGFRLAEAPVTLEFHSRLGFVSRASVHNILMDTLAVFYRLRLLRYYRHIPDTAMPRPAPRVSVVIAFPAVSACLHDCLDGLRRQTVPPDEIILLPDEPCGCAWPPAIREIPTGRLRPAEKRNIGIRAARGDIVAFLDDDAVPAEDWLRHALVYFTDARIAGVGGPGVTPPADGLWQRLSGRVYANPLVSGPYRYRYTPTRVREVDDFPSCNLLVRADVLRRIGGFRADFWPGEDTYLCRDITRKLGLRLYYDPRALVYHHRRKLFVPHLRQVGRYALHRGFFAKRFPETSLRPGYLLPSLLLLGLAGGAVAALLVPALRAVYLAALTVYAALALLSCIPPVELVTLRLRPGAWLLTWLGVMATHIVYGARFLQGLCATRMPGRAQPFDHASERPGRDPAPPPGAGPFAKDVAS